MAAQLHRERAKSVELYTVTMTQRLGNLCAQGIPHEFHVGGCGRGGIIDIKRHLLNVYFLWESYSYSRAPTIGLGTRHLMTQLEGAAHYGFIVVHTAYML
jgi:hypothetical protein